jgi:iron(III) transport system ATP-binding protein
MGDRLAVMCEGRIVQCGTPSELYRRPASPFVASFLGEVERFEGRVAEGRIGTPLGPVPAPGLPEGSAAVALIRPEGLFLDPGALPGLPQARVVDARLLGRTSLIRIALDGIAAPLHARMAGDFLPEAGATVSIRLDCRRAHVFPLDQDASGDAAASLRSPEPDRS